MRKRRACRAVARRLGLNVNRVAGLVQRASEGGLLPVACGSERPHLTNMEMARLLLAAVADRGLGNVAATVRDFSALETEGGLQFCDWLEGVVAGRVDAEPIVSIIFQMDPASVSVLTSAAQMDFGAHEDSPTTCITAISGEALRSIIEDFKNGVG